MAASFGHVDLMRFLCANNDAMIDARNGVSSIRQASSLLLFHAGQIAKLPGAETSPVGLNALPLINQLVIIIIYLF